MQRSDFQGKNDPSTFTYKYVTILDAGTVYLYIINKTSTHVSPLQKQRLSTMSPHLQGC